MMLHSLQSMWNGSDGCCADSDRVQGEGWYSGHWWTVPPALVGAQKEMYIIQKVYVQICTHRQSKYIIYIFIFLFLISTN